MPLEPNFRWIDDLDPANPVDGDMVKQGDDHVRGVKQSMQGNVTGNGTEARLVVGAIARLVSTANELKMLAGNNAPKVALNNAADTTLAAISAAGLAAVIEGLVNDGTLTLRVQVGGVPKDRVVINSEGVILKDGDIDTLETDQGGLKVTGSGTAGAGVSFTDDGGLQCTIVGNSNVLEITGQASVSLAAPTAAEHLTRKDYVDAAILNLQTQLNNLIDGTTKFTGAQEAPDFTAV